MDYISFPSNWDESERMETSVKEKKIVYKDGDEVRVLRGQIFKEDDFFIYVHRLDGDQRIGKNFIIRIEEGNDEKQKTIW